MKGHKAAPAFSLSRLRFTTWAGRSHMVVSLRRGSQWTQKYDDAYYRDPQSGTLNLGRPPSIPLSLNPKP